MRRKGLGMDNPSGEVVAGVVEDAADINALADAGQRSADLAVSAGRARNGVATDTPVATHDEWRRVGIAAGHHAGDLKSFSLRVDAKADKRSYDERDRQRGKHHARRFMRDGEGRHARRLYSRNAPIRRIAS